MEASGFLSKNEQEDSRVCNTMLPDDMDEVASQRTLYVYSFDEDEFAKASASKDWRKYPFDF